MINEELEKVIKCIDARKNFCFNAGAGSGKTYTLIKTIENILQKNSETLQKNNQKILVITYTNAAVDEIKKRLGKTNLVDVSTIHERLWEVIKRFQKDILACHKNKIFFEINKRKEENSQISFINDEKLNKTLNSDDTFQTLFYKNEKKKADEIKNIFNNYVSNGISNVGNFKKYVKNFYRLKKFNETISKISDCEFRSKIEYNPLFNYDRLNHLEFSHDTLLEYSLNLFKNNKTVQRIFSDIYPYVLVDEFQDASENLINILGIVSNNTKTVIGFYGDVAQNIYEQGVGEKLFDNFAKDQIEIIDKQENKRSTSNVVSLANKVRCDKLQQFSSFKEKGITKVYVTSNFVKSMSLVDQISKESIDGTSCCLLLKNELVAEKMGFGSLYKCLEASKYYKDNFDQIGAEIVTDKKQSLGVVPLLLYRISELRKMVNDKKTKILDIIPQSIIKDFNFGKLKGTLNALKNVKYDNLLAFFNSSVDLSHKSNDIKKILDNVFDMNYFSSLDSAKSYLCEALYPDDDLNENVDGANNINSLLSLDFKEIINWYDYVNKDFKENGLVYMTLHSSKGLEFDNVTVVLTNKFHNKKDYFHSLFLNMDSEDKKLARNLLYVSITRAKKNVYIIYEDDNYLTVKTKFESIFGVAEIIS